MKVLFLDIDGVCNNYNTPQRFRGFVGINPELAAHVQRIVEVTGCEVVLSSTWRLDAASMAHVATMVCQLHDRTPDLQQGHRYGFKERGHEVAAWLAEHPEVERYAILDDGQDFLEGQPLFLTTWQHGITGEIADKVIEHLGAA